MSSYRRIIASFPFVLALSRACVTFTTPASLHHCVLWSRSRRRARRVARDAATSSWLMMIADGCDGPGAADRPAGHHDGEDGDHNDAADGDEGSGDDGVGVGSTTPPPRRLSGTPFVCRPKRSPNHNACLRAHSPESPKPCRQHGSRSHHACRHARLHASRMALGRRHPNRPNHRNHVPNNLNNPDRSRWRPRSSCAVKLRFPH